ncbi:hypothetical protein IVB22_33190 [Bradyrhizobium sp. 190]|uniref:hypothetical protein n=1 Tax=Bradyrhizobium sp. 190 TaxID=2782658 RepID=UPI001FFA8292|nr:hypothetical protein [Bradyrhizobium sp. 190]MCK1517276.1 hypothetical protein [Bradyrhizobium sp. 190]
MPAEKDLDIRTAEWARKNPSEAGLIKAVARGFAPVIHDLLQKVFEPVGRDLADLQNRVKELEERPALKYAGIWNSDAIYRTGMFVTDGGSLWHAQRASVNERPGSSDAFVLAAKKGRDAR